MTGNGEGGKGKGRPTDLATRLQAALGAGYRVEKELGGGGMSRVFLAEEVRLGRRVVVKVLPPEMAAGVSVDRFEREIQLAAKLQHPHIVALLTAGASDDLLYYIMPYIEGESLRAKLAREGELPVPEALRILRDVLDALAYAHRHHVVHRDIKPDNVMLSEGHALVTDFGVAKAVAESTGKHTLTSMGVALGTPLYMAPEQAAANPNIDHRADVYAVGVLTYEMLCGRTPFTGPNPQAVLSAHVTQAPEPCTTHRPTVPAALNELVMRCLEKHPADRWQRVEDLRPYVEAILTPTGGVTPTGTQPVISSGTQAAIDRAHPARVAALFGLASVGVLAIVYLLVQAIGLPDWVFYGAIALLAVGLPIMLLTGHHERQRALARSSGRVSVAPPGVRRLFTWRWALLGGGLAFAGLAVGTAAYMVMRVFGIGPVGTLVGSGVLEKRGALIVADFENRTADSGLGPSVAEALRVDLGQSRMIRLLDAAAVTEALQRMKRDPGGRLDLGVAREVAEREGVKAIVTGDIGTLGRGFALSASLLSAPDGRVLVAVRETADSDAGIIGAVNRLSKKLRERIGESLRSIRAGDPLEQVSTGSLEALRLYSRAVKADDVGDNDRATELLEQAVKIDTGFAMAYRKLAVVLGNAGGSVARRVAAATKAFEHRDRLPPIERELATALYYSAVQRDRGQAIAAYRAVLEMAPEERTSHTNLGEVLSSMHRFAEAESLAKQVIVSGHSIWQTYTNLTSYQYRQGKVAEAEATNAEFAARFPNHPQMLRDRAQIHAARGDYSGAERDLQALGASQRESPSWQRVATVLSANVAQVQGKLRSAEESMAHQMAADERRGEASQALGLAVDIARMDVRFRDGPATGIRRVETALQRYPLAAMPAASRPYVNLIQFFSEAGRPDRARQLKTQWEREVDQGLRRGWRQAWVEGVIATAERRSQDAVATYRAFYDEVPCLACGLYELARAYEIGGEMDSALAVSQRAVSISDDGRFASSTVDPSWLAVTYKRLGELYEQRQNREKALEYYGRFADLWKNADPELQPLVRDVKQRMARLVGEGGPR